jgi:hypothetical protein
LLIQAAIRRAAAMTPHHCPIPPSRLLFAPEVAMHVIVARGSANHASRMWFDRKWVPGRLMSCEIGSPAASGSALTP